MLCVGAYTTADGLQHTRWSLGAGRRDLARCACHAAAARGAYAAVTPGGGWSPHPRRAGTPRDEQPIDDVVHDTVSPSSHGGARAVRPR